MTVDTAVAPSLSLDQRHGTCSKTICMSQTCKLTVFVVHWRRFFLISTRHIECIRGVFCDDALYKLTFTLHYGQSSDSLLTLSNLLSCTQLQCCQTRPVRKCLELFMKLLFNLFNNDHGYPLVARRFFHTNGNGTPSRPLQLNFCSKNSIKLVFYCIFSLLCDKTNVPQCPVGHLNI